MSACARACMPCGLSLNPAFNNANTLACARNINDISLVLVCSYCCLLSILLTCKYLLFIILIIYPVSVTFYKYYIVLVIYISICLSM